MQETRYFIQKHQAKLAWKMVRYGVKVLARTEEVEGHGPVRVDRTGFIET